MTTLDDLARAAYATHHDLGYWPEESAAYRADVTEEVAAVVLALAGDIEAAVDYMGSEPNHWANANHRLRTLIAEARARTRTGEPEDPADPRPERGKHPGGTA